MRVLLLKETYMKKSFLTKLTEKSGGRHDWIHELNIIMAHLSLSLWPILTLLYVDIILRLAIRSLSLHPFYS